MSIRHGSGFLLSSIGNEKMYFRNYRRCGGSLFVFKGKYRAVLVNYPSRAEKRMRLPGNRNAVLRSEMEFDTISHMGYIAGVILLF